MELFAAFAVVGVAATNNYFGVVAGVDVAIAGVPIVWLTNMVWFALCLVGVVHQMGKLEC